MKGLPSNVSTRTLSLLVWYCHVVKNKHRGSEALYKQQVERLTASCREEIDIAVGAATPPLSRLPTRGVTFRSFPFE